MQNRKDALLALSKFMSEDNNSLDDGISFSVDAGIINRLGKELVGRAETAVSELVKNAYDADATLVELRFIDTDSIGGELLIIDNGTGMSRKQLIDGFMRLSSSDKIHNPVSSVYHRLRAGRKGIGRFATQRLGNRLTILTKALGSNITSRLEIDWTRYETDKDLSSIKNKITEAVTNDEPGTHLIITDLRESWDEYSIRRIYRYVGDLLQPNYLSDRSKNLNIASAKQSEAFEVRFVKTSGNIDAIIADVNNMVFDNALGVIEGYAANDIGICEVISNRFDVNDEFEIREDFSLLTEVHFKVYYFIYSYDWFESFIPRIEYNQIVELSENNGGIKLYRNGFRVLPYGEKGNDWLNIDKTAVKTLEGGYVPFNNVNFFGFVEVLDSDGNLFEETSSREGLIENTAFNQLTTFLYKALRLATQRINSARLAEKRRNAEQNIPTNNNTANNQSTIEKLLALKGQDANANAVIEEAIQKLEELEMLRILAGLGLNIAEFTHEIRQFIPSFNGSIAYMLSQSFSPSLNETLYKLRDNFHRFRTYTAYIDHTISQTSNRDKIPINLITEIKDFIKVIRKDAESENIDLEMSNYGFDLITRPMHPSEWISILYNFYTNSKKALNREQPLKKKIKIVCGTEENKIYLEFMDNGDGIQDKYKNKVFDAFFTTSAPMPNKSSKNDALTGTGLGLKIVKDIIIAYNGAIFLTNPEQGFNTCFRIEIEKSKKTS